MDAEHLATLYRDVFETDARGALLLEDMTRRFAKPAVTKGGIDAVLATYLNAGSRRVLDHIVRQINRANGVNDDRQPEEEATS